MKIAFILITRINKYPVATQYSDYYRNIMHQSYHALQTYLICSKACKVYHYNQAKDLEIMCIHKNHLVPLSIAKKSYGLVNKMMVNLFYAIANCTRDSGTRRDRPPSHRVDLAE